MDKTYDIKGIGGDKIALLGLFILALLVARLIVASKSAIILSEPIKLAHTGLSVSMPAGNGWTNSKQWQYQGNAFFLSSNFTLGSNKPSAWAYCRYLLAAEKTTPQIRFEQKASEVGGEIVKKDQIKTGALTFDWALIEKLQTPLGFIFGTVKLPNNHQLDIEVYQIMGDADVAERIFKGIVKSLNFEDTTADDIVGKFSRQAEYILLRQGIEPVRDATPRWRLNGAMEKVSNGVHKHWES